MCRNCNFWFRRRRHRLGPNLKHCDKTNPHRQPFGNARGFSLIEVAVVLLVIAIIAAILIPRVLDYMRAYRLGIATRNVATALQRARFLATSNNTRAGVSIQSPTRVDIEQYDLSGKREPENKGTIFLPEGIMVTSNVPMQIAFDGRGLVTPRPKEVQVIRIKGARGYFQTVSVSLTGQVTVSDATQEGE